MHVVILIAAIGLVRPTEGMARVHEGDVIEVILTRDSVHQVILWTAGECDGWIMCHSIPDGTHWSIRPDGRVSLVWYAGGILHVLIGKRKRLTRTDHDPEIEDRELRGITNRPAMWQ